MIVSRRAAIQTMVAVTAMVAVGRLPVSPGFSRMDGWRPSWPFPARYVYDPFFGNLSFETCYDLQKQGVHVCLLYYHDPNVSWEVMRPGHGIITATLNQLAVADHLVPVEFAVEDNYPTIIGECMTRLRNFVN